MNNSLLPFIGFQGVGPCCCESLRRYRPKPCICGQWLMGLTTFALSVVMKQRLSAQPQTASLSDFLFILCLPIARFFWKSFPCFLCADWTNASVCLSVLHLSWQLNLIHIKLCRTDTNFITMPDFMSFSWNSLLFFDILIFVFFFL